MKFSSELLMFLPAEIFVRHLAEEEEHESLRSRSKGSCQDVAEERIGQLLAVVREPSFKHLTTTVQNFKKYHPRNCHAILQFKTILNFLVQTFILI